MGRASLRCSRCQIYIYCPTECQRTSWSHPEHPHRKICKHLGVLAAVWPEDMLRATVISHTFAEMDGKDEGLLQPLADKARYSSEQVMEVWQLLGAALDWRVR
ncbi:hypothetical protein BDV98DRAFT_54398 [Pterulicium gracile]|uniref:MYND-type domain-containing protein n=1 Tax=Pterulicium gracile TaxID=1884261 RepID=A0A5C3QKZ6_9AGAR|nr:hypothetical protein BDV98DRAFT_54398 [Pterula gracilis]